MWFIVRSVDNALIVKKLYTLVLKLTKNTSRALFSRGENFEIDSHYVAESVLKAEILLSVFWPLELQVYPVLGL